MRPRDEARLKASDVWRAAWRIDGPTNEGDLANAIGEGFIHRDLKPANTNHYYDPDVIFLVPVQGYYKACSVKFEGTAA